VRTVRTIRAVRAGRTIRPAEQTTKAILKKTTGQPTKQTIPAVNAVRPLTALGTVRPISVISAIRDVRTVRTIRAVRAGRTVTVVDRKSDAKGKSADRQPTKQTNRTSPDVRTSTALGTVRPIRVTGPITALRT